MMRLLYALRFLTILPLPYKEGENLDDVARSVVFFPLVGAIIGGLVGFSALGLQLLWPLPVTAVVILILEVVLTGGLHWDGVADVADGIGGGRDPESRLEVMKDSRIGAFGTLALLCGLVLKGVLIWSLLNRFSGRELVLVFLAVSTISRGSQVLSIFIFPYPKSEGIGIFFKERTGLFHLLLSLIQMIVLVGLFLGFSGLWLLVLGFGASLLTGGILILYFRGVNGDGYGLITEVSEIVLLASLVVII